MHILKARLRKETTDPVVLMVSATNQDVSGVPMVAPYDRDLLEGVVSLARSESAKTRAQDLHRARLKRTHFVGFA